jgi:uncharacterized surface protein with fasciclin (FAS1) repeats
MQSLFCAPNHATLAAALVAADMAECLEGRGPYTLFAPTNRAFDRHPGGPYPGLWRRDERATLAKALCAHLVVGRFSFRDLRAAIDGHGGHARLATLSGDPLTLGFVHGAIRLTTSAGAKALIVGPDRHQTNGLIHAVDGVLAPWPIGRST